MNWPKVIRAMREEVVAMRDQLPKVPGNEVASNAALGASIMILAKIADAFEAGLDEQSEEKR